MHILLRHANALLSAGGFDYAVCGGFAIDLFLGRETRAHGDIDISVYWPQRDGLIRYFQALGWEVYEMCGGGKAHKITRIEDQLCIKRNIFCIKPGCPLLDLTPTAEKEIYAVNFHSGGQTSLDFIEFLFNDRTDEYFLYAREHMIKRELQKAILLRENVPFLAPEVVLLYKSTDTERTGYQADFENARAEMSPDQRHWLEAALARMYLAGHKWRTISDTAE